MPWHSANVYTAGKTLTDRAADLMARYGAYVSFSTSAPTQFTTKSGDVPSDEAGGAPTGGRCSALLGFDQCVDDLITALCTMADDFKHTEPKDYLESLHLLRLIGPAGG